MSAAAPWAAPLLARPREFGDRGMELVLARAGSLRAGLGLCDPPARDPPGVELEALGAKLVKTGQITDFPVHAMLCAEPGDPRIDRLRAHVLAASLDDLAEGRNPAMVRSACRIVRHLRRDGPETFGEFWSILCSVPAGADSQALLRIIEAELLRRPKSLSTDPAARECRGLLVRLGGLLRRYVDRRVRTSVRDAMRTRHSAPVVVAGEPGAEGDPPAAARHDFFDGRPGREDDIEAARTYLEPAPGGLAAHAPSAYIQARRARSVAERFVRDEAMPPVRWGAPSPLAFGGVVRALREGVAAGRVEDAVLAASLVCGRPAGRIAAMKVRKRAAGRGRGPGEDVIVARGGAPALRSTLSLPAPTGPAACCEPADPAILIPLPEEIAFCLPSLGDPGLAEDVQRRLRDLRRGLPFATASRVASAGRFWLYEGGHGRTLPARLFGESAARAVPLVYENMEVGALLRAHALWTGHINSHIAEHPFTFAALAGEARTGSRRCPSAGALGGLLRACRERAGRALAGGAPAWQAHNLYVAHTYLLLMLASGARPARQAFETLSDHCAATGTHLLMDKATWRAAVPRIVPLADFALAQMEFHLAYLAELKSLLDARQRSREYILGALEGRRPFLFTLDADLEPEPLSPAAVHDLLGADFPFDHNWNRHFLRTELTRRGVGDEEARAFLGHGGVGQAPFGHHSALAPGALRDVARVVNRIAADLGVEPLPGTPRLPGPGQGAALTALPARGARARGGDGHLPQRERNAARRRRERLRRERAARRWMDSRTREVADAPERFRDVAPARAWVDGALAALDEAFPEEAGWVTGRWTLWRTLGRLNREHGLELPVPAPPVPPRPAPCMRDEAMFRAQRAVWPVADAFQRALWRGRGAGSPTGRGLPALVAFSAACFGGLAEPEALLAFARAVWDGEAELFHAAGHGVCWVECVYESRRRNNLVVDGAPRRMRRFLLDGMTLALLAARPWREHHDPVSPPRDAASLMRAIRGAVGGFCGARLPPSMTLRQFTRGAITVVEARPGRPLPNYLSEYACGVVDSVPLPGEYLRHYLGEDAPAPARGGAALPRVVHRAAPDPPGRPGPSADPAIRALTALFSGMGRHTKRHRREELLGRMDRLVAESRPPALDLLVRWLRHLVADRRLRPATARRYASWIGRPWLVGFDAVDPGALDADDWHDGYAAIVEAAPAGQRLSMAGRFDDLHRFLVRERGYPAMPGQLHSMYRGRRMVRARVIPERTFAAFKVALLASGGGDAEKRCQLWIFVLCYRLGIRIGEAVRILVRDIEEGGDPHLFLRANRFGDMKTGRPHQMPLFVFLPGPERRGLRAWLATRRRMRPGPGEPLFGPPGTTGVVWEARGLERLFTDLMRRVSGMRFTTHDCRHAAACRLAWLAEGIRPPDDCAYTAAERRALRRALFTANPVARDRIWQLASALNHASPETTLGSYVHVYEMLLHAHVAQGGPRVPADALAALLGCSRRRIAAMPGHGAGGFPIEEVLPLIHALRPGLFTDAGGAPAPEAEAGGEPGPDEAGRPDFNRYDRAPAVLADLEGGSAPEEVADRHGVPAAWVARIGRAAGRIAAMRTRRGVPRHISAARARAGGEPIAPARLPDSDDQRLSSAILEGLRRGWPGNRESIVAACRHWLGRANTSTSHLVFHSPAELARFLECFEACGAVPRRRWLVRVSPPGGARSRRPGAAWKVFPNLGVRVEGRAGSATGYPHGIARLHLLKEGPPRAGATKDTSKALRHLLHMLTILLDVHPDEPGARVPGRPAGCNISGG